MKRCLPVILLLLALPMFCSAGNIQGTVKDANGEELPFATVYVQGTTIGTSANAAGFYQLHLDAGTYKIICQYMGFNQSTYNVTITGNETVAHNFTLQEQKLEMKEHVVKASEDPAKYIMRKVIKRRQFHLNQIQAFQTRMYLKGTLRTRDVPEKLMGEKIEKKEMGVDSTGKGVLLLLEQEASYYTQGDKERTVIHSVRQSGSTNGLGMSQMPPVINFYANNIAISSQLNPRGFISPLSEGAFNYYNYKLEGDFKEGDYTIFRIKVTPKRLYEPLFSGTLYIVDEEWGIHSLDMLVTKKSNMEFLDSFRIEQFYLPLRKDEWVIKQQVWYPTFKFFGFDFTGNFVTVYDDQKVNQPLPDTIFNKKIISVYDKDANKKDTSYWTSRRPVPLEADEQKDYIVKDSMRRVYEDPDYIDSMRRKYNKPGVMDLVQGGYSYNSKGYKTNIRTNAVLSGLVNYNTIEGWNTAPRVWVRHKLDTFHYLNGSIAARYGFGNTHFNSMGKLTYTTYDRKFRSRNESFEVEGGKYVFQLNPHNPVDPLYNTISSLFYRKNYLKLYERWTAAAAYRRTVGNGLRYGIKASWQQRLPLENSSDFTYAKSGVGGFTDNSPSELSHFVWEKHNAFIASAFVSWQPGYTFTQYPDYIVSYGSDYPTFTLNYEKGIPDILGSKTDFDKWRLSVRDDINLRLLGSLSYNLAAGGFLNKNYASIPDLTHIRGNQFLLASPYLESFQLAPIYTFSNAEPLYGEAHVEWYLKGFLTNKIPLLRQLRWYLVAGTNSFYANKDLWHAEAYVGIDNLGYDKFRVLRLDYIWGWNSLGQPLTGIRLGISPSALIGGMLQRDDYGEW